MVRRFCLHAPPSERSVTAPAHGDRADHRGAGALLSRSGKQAKPTHHPRVRVRVRVRIRPPNPNPNPTRSSASCGSANTPASPSPQTRRRSNLRGHRGFVRSSSPLSVKVAIGSADTVFVSVASAWAIAIKQALGKVRLPPACPGHPSYLPTARISTAPAQARRLLTDARRSP
jgi:hypothetical protein